MRRELRFPRPFPVLLAALLAATGCSSDPPQKFSCSVPTSKNIGDAFVHARNDLSRQECQFQFDDYIDTLLTTATSNPSEDNKERFSSLFAWSRDRGILSQVQAQEYYRRYFTPNFVTLDTRYNNCSTTCRDKAMVIRAMKKELADKDRGLLRAAQDRAGYAQADKEYNDLLTLIEATCQACQNAR